MSYEDRVQLYEQIEEIRGRPLIAYYTSLRPNASGQIASDVIPHFARQISKISESTKEVDILIVSYGGDPTVAWRLITMLRERFDKVGVLIPFAAYSAATLLALGADEIVMHPFSNLGPVDPQLTYPRKNPDGTVEQIQFGAEDLRHFLDFVKKDVGVSDQEPLERAFELICTDVGSIPIGVAKRSSYLALSLGEKLLSLHMKDQNKVRAISEALNKSFYHHGYPVGRREAKEIGLPVTEPSEDLEKLMWEVWKDIEKEMECDKPFEPIELVLNSPEAGKLLSPVTQIDIPMINGPPEIAQQIYTQIMQGVMSSIKVREINPVPYELLIATIESPRARSEFKVKGKILAMRLPDLRITVNVLKTSGEWAYEDI
ncbi:hypothetical protein A3L09_05205 [Thermococcus profundus]|uniref:Serine protease n=1 Tax=Thermococcus profundus TaxID=49899 RepID=A0A2Z2MB47_THEPR|nr:hypothetical protein [Thermococcus profundus]ASJ02693.1 hypothetical protein A3L09_05205 [Thermococcus profundus]